MAQTEKTSRTLAIEHIRIACQKGFNEVHAALLKSLPNLDPELLTLLESGTPEDIAAKRALGPKLWLFSIRDHGRLLSAERPGEKTYQYEIGNPLTAARMTRHKLPAALYAPLRVVLYRDSDGRAFFEYDRPSSLFAQFRDEHVTAVGRELDDELESLLLAAAH